MTIFVDTSGLIATLDTADQCHELARDAWVELLDGDDDLMTTNYVVLETAAIIQRRIGMDSLSRLQSEVLPAIEMHCVDAPLHSLGMQFVLRAGRRQLSVVDTVSFLFMREHGLRRYFGFDKHFRAEGFEAVVA